MLSALRDGAAGMSCTLGGQAALVPGNIVSSIPGLLPARSQGPCGAGKQAPALRRGEAGLRRQPLKLFSSQRPHILSKRQGGGWTLTMERGKSAPVFPEPHCVSSVTDDLPRPRVRPFIPATLRPIWRPSLLLPQNVSSSPMNACGFPAGARKPHPPNTHPEQGVPGHWPFGLAEAASRLITSSRVGSAPHRPPL